MKDCRKCWAPLINDQNWSLSKQKRYEYICNQCERIRARERRVKSNNASFKEWAASNLDRVMWYSAKKRAMKDGVPFAIKPSDIVIPAECPVFGTPLRRGVGKGCSDDSPTLDRFNPSLGYVIGNICVISGKANRIKSDADEKDIEAVLAWMKTH